MTDFYRVKYQGHADRRAKTSFFECKRYDANGFCGRKVNKNGDYIDVKWTADGCEDALHIITAGCIISAELVIHDFKYGELVKPQDATQNQESFGRISGPGETPQ